jgi:hypothetical protein
MAITTISHLAHKTTAKVTRPEVVIRLMEVTRKAKAIRAARVINRFTTITLDGKVKQTKRNTSRKRRRKGANIRHTMTKIHMDRNITSMNKGNTGRSIRKATNTRRRDTQRYSRAAANIAIRFIVAVRIRGTKCRSYVTHTVLNIIHSPVFRFRCPSSGKTCPDRSIR